MRKEYIPVSRISSEDYFDIEIFFLDKRSNSFKVIKPKGIGLSKVCSLEERKALYLKAGDEIGRLERENSTLYTELARKIKVEDLIKVKDIIVRMVTNFFAFPRNSNLKNTANMVNMIVDEFTRDKTVIKKLAMLSNKDVTTAQHSVNVMSYTISYCLHRKMDKEQIKLYGLSGLLHDVGKLEIEQEILNAPRKLTNEEFTHIKGHTLGGANILKDHLFCQEVIDGALYHHERMDGSGYPKGVAKCAIPEIGQILAIIDPFEALTTDERPYRRKISQTEALELLYKETGTKLNREIYFSFIDSLSIVTLN